MFLQYLDDTFRVSYLRVDDLSTCISYPTTAKSYVAINMVLSAVALSFSDRVLFQRQQSPIGS